jgi:hypothetical protein
MMCKDGHHYLKNDIFPLRESTFEGAPVKVPFAYVSVLIEEYGPTSVSKKRFKNHQFDQERMEWMPM